MEVKYGSQPMASLPFIWGSLENFHDCGRKGDFFLIFFCNFHQTDSLGEFCGRQEFKKHTNSNFMKDHLGCSLSFPLTDSVS